MKGIRNLGKVALLLKEAKEALNEVPEEMIGCGLEDWIDKSLDRAREMFLAQIDGGYNGLIRFYIDAHQEQDDKKASAGVELLRGK